jgi:hypothetical protein
VIKIGVKVVSHGRYVTFQMAEVAVPRQMFREILMLIARFGRRPLQHEGAFGGRKAWTTMGDVLRRQMTRLQRRKAS